MKELIGLDEVLLKQPQCYLASMHKSESAGRTRDVLFYSGAKVARYDWWSGEEYDLSFDLDGADLSRLKADAPVLNGHSSFDVRDVIGVVENPRRSKEGYVATMRFSERPEVDGIWKDVEDNILRNVSMGVEIKKLVLAEDDKKKNRKHYMAKEWQPFEISVVPIGADPGAKFLSADPRFGQLREDRGELSSVLAGAARHTEIEQAKARLRLLALRAAR